MYAVGSLGGAWYRGDAKASLHAGKMEFVYVVLASVMMLCCFALPAMVFDLMVDWTLIVQHETDFSLHNIARQQHLVPLSMFDSSTLQSIGQGRGCNTATCVTVFHRPAPLVSLVLPAFPSCSGLRPETL